MISAVPRRRKEAQMGQLVTARRVRRARVSGMAAAGAAALLLPMAVPAAAETGSELDLDEPAVVEVLLDDRDELDRLVDQDADIANVEEGDSGLIAYTVVFPFQAGELSSAGFEFGDIVFTLSDSQDRAAEREATIAAHEAENEALQDEVSTLADEDTVQILRADYFEGRDGNFLSVEAKTSDGQDADFELTALRDSGPGTEIGSGGEQTLGRFFDVGVYLYHRGMAEVDERPEYVEVVSPNGGSDIAEVTEWLPDPDDPAKPPPFTDFVTAYMTPNDLNERIHQLAAEFPDLAEVVELPHETNGYQRHAQALFGTELGDDGAPVNTEGGVVVESHAWGHEGGNDISVELADPGTADSELSVEVDGDAITVNLTTDGDGAVTSTSAEVVAALNAEADELVLAYTFRGDDGDGVVEPDEAQLSDFLDAPDEVSRDPHPVYMLRIGAERDGSKLGVLGYAQEHAREWQTPLVTIETAERLLRNYGVHEPTTELVDNLDIFLVPSVNPDGANYSFYDNGFQRKNMTNYCPTDGPRDPLFLQQEGGGAHWGVDNNRNYGAYTLWDGYAGASTNCIAQTFAGPFDEGPMSQPENQNLVWIADEHENITFSMNIHSWGDYFMWAPGAYIAEGRVPAPRPTLAEEAYFWAASESILTAIKQHRDTVVTPARTGPVIDVLYSAAGNSGDHLWYLNDIYAWNFELGSAGFQPEWEEAHQQALEYSNGLYNMLEVAYAYDTDDKFPRSKLVPGQGIYEEPVEVTFETSEPASVYYTLDGSRPTFESPRLELSGLREGPETILIEETTAIKWFSVDVAGNTELNYDPDGNRNNYRRARVIIRDWG